MENPKKIAFVSFQPVSFTGRDEDITPERRLRQRYTLSHLAKDVSTQVGKVEPTRDWFPISFIRDRKSTRLNSSHSQISYAVFCLKKKKTISNCIHRIG